MTEIVMVVVILIPWNLCFDPFEIWLLLEEWLSFSKSKRLLVYRLLVVLLCMVLFVNAYNKWYYFYWSCLVMIRNDVWCFCVCYLGFASARLLLQSKAQVGIVFFVLKQSLLVTNVCVTVFVVGTLTKFIPTCSIKVIILKIN